MTSPFQPDRLHMTSPSVRELKEMLQMKARRCDQLMKENEELKRQLKEKRK